MYILRTFYKVLPIQEARRRALTWFRYFLTVLHLVSDGQVTMPVNHRRVKLLILP